MTIKSIKISCRNGFFYEHDKHKGYYWQDYPPYKYEINHVQHYSGIYGELKFGYKLNKKITFILSIRDRFGYSKMHGKSTNNSIPLSPNMNGFRNFLEPVSSAGFRYSLGK